ncbi:MAG TPA: hypothetical protein VFR35_17860, partial [Actinoplanes sp.]|nr:hypothetical protein [Actinoplanes sp.]
QRRPSEHSMMRWLGFDWDQVGREHMVARITGMRNAGQMSVRHTPPGTVAADSVLWIETGHPRFHELDVTWRIGGADGTVLDTHGSRSLDLDPLDLPAGTVVHVEVRDPVGPAGIDWVRNPSTGNTSTNSGYNGPRFVQSREWTVGEGGVAPAPPAAEITASTMTSQPVAGDEVVFVETNHPADRIVDVTWSLDGAPVPNPHNSRRVDLGSLNLPAGTHRLAATVTDPADPGGVSDRVEWTVDNATPTAPRRLSAPLTTLPGALEHPVYFDGWDMWLEPRDDLTGYPGERHVVGQFRLDRDGWFNYFGFPERPIPDSPFQFRHSGTNVKALTYGNLGTGGLSRATFEQTLPDDHPSGGFVPGFGTHTVEHRAIDPAGNVGPAASYQATVLPGASPACTTTLTGRLAGVIASQGVTCLTNAQVAGSVTVRAGASLVVRDSTVNGALTSTSAQAVQLFGSTVNGVVTVTSTTRDVTVAGNRFNGAVVLSGNTQVSANERYTRLAGPYGPLLVGNQVNGDLTCSGNNAPVKDFGAPNTVRGAKVGDCAQL